jgi:hypothetical protein
MRIFAGLLLLSALFPPLQSSGAQGVQSVEPWFTVTISMPRTVVTIGTDVKLKVVLTNKTAEDIRYSGPGPGRGGPVFDLDVRDGEGKPASETPRGLTVHGKDPRPWSGSIFSTAAHPGEKIEEEVVLNEEYNLGKPGKYTVQLRERNPKFQAVKSDTVTFTLVPRKAP